MSCVVIFTFRNSKSFNIFQYSWVCHKLRDAMYAHQSQTQPVSTPTLEIPCMRMTVQV